MAFVMGRRDAGSAILTSESHRRTIAEYGWFLFRRCLASFRVFRQPDAVRSSPYPGLPPQTIQRSRHTDCAALLSFPGHSPRHTSHAAPTIDAQHT